MIYCAINCQNVVRRTVWDGDQVLAEIQAPGDSGASSTLMESDGGLSVHVDAGSVVLPDSLGSDADVAPTDTMPQAQIYRGYQFGRVVYTHGPGIDAPLSLIRMDYSDSIRTPQLVVLHSDWRGEYDIGSYAGGTLTKPCVRITRSSNFKTYTSDGSISDYPKAPGPINTSWYHCVEVEWPAPHVWVTRDTRNRSLNGPIAWMGTLIDGMRDNSGQMYMRNRYYDPASGRFTQEDPIGLAGGLNAYGFANGDPVAYSDPYGLRAQECPPVCPLIPFMPVPVPTPEMMNDAGRIAEAGARRYGGAYKFFIPPAVGIIVTRGANFLHGLFANESPEDILMPGGEPIGTAGSSSDIREVPGGVAEAGEMFDHLTEGGTKISSTYPGTRVELPSGGTVGIRTKMTRSPGTAATIDVDIPGIPISKIKFNP